MQHEALRLIEEYWGGMVKAGADTFWEAYDPKNSLFSPYGVGPELPPASFSASGFGTTMVSLTGGNPSTPPLGG